MFISPYMTPVANCNHEAAVMVLQTFFPEYERPDLLLFLTADGEASSCCRLLYLGHVFPLAFHTLSGVFNSKDGKSM